MAERMRREKDSRFTRSFAPPAPSGFDTERFFTGIYWHQKWEMFQGIFTPGRNPISELMANAGLPDGLDGLRVLDVGAFNCCASFECERRGAAEVVALDLQPAEQLGFPQMARALDSRRVEFKNGSAYHLDPGKLGEFDVVLFFGILYHLRYPLLALDQIRRITRGTLYLETIVLDHRVIQGSKDWGQLADYHPALTCIPLWQFYKSNELAGDYSNWFSPNIQAVLGGLESAGFKAELIKQYGDRATFQARPSVVSSEKLEKSYEGMSTIVKRDVGLL